MRKLLIALFILVVLVIAVDRIGVVLAEDQIASRIATAYNLPTDPGVSITGFPFLTQVVTGNYQQIDVTADQVQADGATLHDLNVHLTGVHATISQLLGSGTSTVTADRAAGSALVPDHPGREEPHGVRQAVVPRARSTGDRFGRPRRIRLRHHGDARERQPPWRDQPAGF